MAQDVFGDPRWEVFGLLREAYLAVSAAIDSEVRNEVGLSPDIADLLFRLARTPGHTLKTIDVTRALSTTTTRTTRVVDEAEGLGLVQRQTHPNDRRVTLVALSDEGLVRAVSAADVALDAAQRHVHDVLDQNATDQLSGSLRRLRNATRESTEVPDGP